MTYMYVYDVLDDLYVCICSRKC